jgi:pilus assembly protein CpaF
MLNIAVTTPKGNTSQIECTIDNCSVGKSDENLIALQGWTVAKKHAAIQRKPDGVYVEDLGSSSGTEVNGQKITRHGPLKPGDKIAIAGYTLEVLDLELPAYCPAPAPTEAPRRRRFGLRPPCRTA